jgi:predicted MFS family arabinose efflux permease
MRRLLSPDVAVPLTTIFGVQVVLTMGAYALPVIIPLAALDLGIEPDSIGFLVAAIYVTAMLVGLTSGGLLVRFGPTRTFQALLLLVAAGAVVLMEGSAWAALACAILFGAATGPMNPTGSQVLARITTSDIRALVFSLKQCGTPGGGMLAGSLLPLLALEFGWRDAMLALPLMAGLLVVLIPFGRLGGPVASSGADTSLRGALVAIRTTLIDPAIRAVTITGFGLAVCQMGLTTYLIVFLWSDAGYSPAQAGLVFAVLHVSGIASRIVLGVIADRVLSTRWVLVLISFVLGAALMLIANLTDEWPITAVYAVMALTGASGNGWVGLYFAELARLSPPHKVAEVAAGSQFVTYLGIVCGPLLCGTLLHLTGSYQWCFVVLGVMSLICGIYLASQNRGGNSR